MDLESRYELLEKVGAGSYATVFRARDLELGREVAVKQIHDQFLSDPQQLDRYWQEAQLLASLHHPNIVTIFDIHRERGWLIMELMHGNLAERMEGRQMELKALRTSLAHALRALKYLHSRGIAHGDIKPSNLMIDARKRVKLGDFGLARRVSDDEGSLLKGTTKYMAPEVVSEEFGEVGPASDLYSLGFSAYELMCGPNFESLFPGLSAFGRNKQVAWMMWHAAADRRLPDISRVLEGVPEDLQKVIQKLVEKDQGKRYKSADEALSDLNIDVKVVQKGGESEIQDTMDGTNPAQKKRTMIAAAAFALSLLVSLAVAFWPSGSKPTDTATAKKFYGLVREVLPEKNILVVEDLETGTPREVAIASTPKIFRQNDKKNILLRQLQPADRVELPIPAPGSPQVISEFVVSQADRNEGRIKSVDAQSRQIVVAVEQGDLREDLPVRIPDRATLKINGADKPLRDFKEGDSVGVRHFPDVTGKGVRIADEVIVRRLAEAVGFVSDYEPGRKRLTVRFGTGASATSISLPIASDCEIRLQGRGSESSNALKMDELARDDRARVWYDTEFRRIIVTRDSKKITAVVQQVLPLQRELEVTTSTGKSLVFRVDPSIEATNEVTLDRDNVGLIDLRMYDNVEIAYDDSSGQTPVASSVYATRPSRADRWAILIGGEVYDDKFLSPVRTAIDDAEHLQRTLRSRYAVPEDRLLFLKDEPRSRIQAEVVRLLDAARVKTQVVVYVSCHAYLGADGQVYLAGKDFHYDKMTDTGVPLDWLVARLEQCAAEDKLLLLDISRKGIGRDLEKQPSTEEMVKALRTPLRSTTIIASCAGDQRGLQSAEQDLGLFSTSLAEAFSGKADKNLDLRITASELFASLQSTMAKSKAVGGGTQTPAIFEPKASAASDSTPKVRLAD